jgi:hypothetical protein
MAAASLDKEVPGINLPMPPKASGCEGRCYGYLRRSHWKGEAWNARWPQRTGTSGSLPTSSRGSSSIGGPELPGPERRGEFLERWQFGHYEDSDAEPGVRSVIMLLPFARLRH